MSRFLKKILFFLLPILVYLVVAMFAIPQLLTLKYGPTTKQQIKFSLKMALEREYDMLILGNSRTYRGLNPAFFSLCTHNFSHDHDSYNQIYFKLKYLIDKKEKEFDYLILGTDYFQFSYISNTRNYVYGDIFGAEYLKDYGENLWELKIDYYLRSANPVKLLSLFKKTRKGFVRKNGQYIRPGLDAEIGPVKRDINRLEVQEYYFSRIIDKCLAEGITIFIVMPPLRKEELLAYTLEEKKAFAKYLQARVDNKRVYYLNFSENHSFSANDFTDLTHFNESAANRFSKILNDTIIKLVFCNNSLKK